MDPEKALSLMSEEDRLKELFESTEDGRLTIPRYYFEDLHWHRPSEDPDRADYYDCYTMRWKEQDLKPLLDEYRTLRADLETLAEKAEAFGEEEDFEADADGVRAFLQDERLFGVWNTYIRDWETEELAPEKRFMYTSIESDFQLYFDRVAMEEAMADGYQLTEDDKELYEAIKDISVSEEDLAGYDRYWECVAADAERRVGSAPGAQSLVLRAKRLWKLLEGNAPQIIIQNEACELAQALALHRFAETVEQIKA